MRRITSALVTGAGAPNGIGFATARLLARSGLSVAITSSTDRIFARREELAAEGLSIRAAIADLTDSIQVSALRSDIGPVDVLVNNAGMGSVSAPAVSRRFLELGTGDWDRGVDASLKTAFLATRAFLPDMVLNRCGRVIFIASVTGPFVAIEGEAAYAAAKAGIVGLTRCLALEAGRSGVTVNAIAPGWIDTGASTPFERDAALHTPLGRAGTPAEVAAAVAFLASDTATYINGIVLVVDGGNMLQESKPGRIVS